MYVTKRIRYVWPTSQMGHVLYKAYGACMVQRMGHVWMFLGWTPLKLKYVKSVKIGVLPPICFIKLWVILSNFWPNLKRSFSLKTLTGNQS